MHVILGADHGGFKMKEVIKSWLGDEGYEVIDVGASAEIPEDDFVDYAKAAVAEAVVSGDRIVLFCRNGFGMMITANRFVGVRCGLAFDEQAVAKGRSDDDINCLSVPSDYINEELVKNMIRSFLTEKFDGEEKYKRRIMKMDNIIS